MEGKMENPKESRTQTDQNIPYSMSKTEIDKTLITLVKKMYPIWDKTCNNYPNKQLKNQLWENIGAQLSLDKNACMLRWKSLREKYIRQKVKYHQEGEKWELLDELSFLDKVIQFRKKHTDPDHHQNEIFLDHPQTVHYPAYPRPEAPRFSQESDSSFSTLSQQNYGYETADDSSNDHLGHVKSENSAATETSDSCTPGRRKRVGSVTSEASLGKSLRTEERGTRSPEELFGELVAAMLRRRPEGDRNRCMIEIMTVLSK